MKFDCRKVTRRGLLKGSAATAAASLASGVYKPAIANTDPIQIGYLPAFTGPSSSTGIGIGRGTQLAVEEINAAGGIKGRKIELVMRDTQSDPTKAVNAAAELTRRHKVAVMWGPLNSGETAAAIANIARDGVPHIHPCWVDIADRRQEVPDGVPQRAQQPADRRRRQPLRRQRLEGQEGRRHQRHVTGYGTASLDAYVPMLKKIGGDVVYSAASMPTTPTSSRSFCACARAAPRRSCRGA